MLKTKDFQSIKLNNYHSLLFHYATLLPDNSNFAVNIWLMYLETDGAF